MPPFSSVMSYGESVKNSWSNPSTEPPAPHTELWTVAKFAETTKVPLESAMRNLADGGCQSTVLRPRCRRSPAGTE